MADLIISTELGKPSTQALQSAVIKAGQDAGEKGGREIERGFSEASRRIRNIYLSLAASITSAFAIGKITGLAAEQQDAINKLNTSLALSGKFSKEASQRLQDFASSLQSSTKFGDEVILKNAALIQSLGRLDEQGLKRATKAAADLSAALGIDFEQASILVGRAAQGQIQSFTRLGIQIRQGVNEAETFSNVLSALESRFGGSAQSEIRTFSGALAQAKNAFGDFFEEFGRIITNSPLIIKGIQIVTQAIQFASVRVREFADSFNFVDQIVVPLSKFAKNIIKYIIAPLEIVTNVVLKVFSFVNEQITNFVNFVIEKTRPLARVLDAIGSKVGEAFAKISEQTSSFFQSQNEGGFFAGFLDTSFSDKLTTQLEQGVIALQNFNNQASLQAQEFKFNFQDVLQNSTAETAVAIDETAKQINQTIQQNLVRGISGGIQNVVTSIFKGENAFSNFGKFVLNTMGDLAIQLGQVLIGAGIGIESLKSLGGSAAIAAGAGLVALGAVLKSLSGGASTSSPTSTGGNNFSPVEPATNVGELSDPQGQNRKETAAVNLTIQGDVLDSEESGLRIAKLISSAAGKTGVVLRSARSL